MGVTRSRTGGVYMAAQLTVPRRLVHDKAGIWRATLRGKKMDLACQYMRPTNGQLPRRHVSKNFEPSLESQA